MNVKNLTELLKDLPPNLPVYIWIDGERYPIVDIDDSLVEDGHVDINAAPRKRLEAAK
jgi:hypothetical protein